MNKNHSYTIKLDSDQEFVFLLEQILNKYIPLKESLLPGELLVIETLEKIRSAINKEIVLDTRQASFINFRPYWELQGGEEFLETSVGQEIIDLLFYFAFKYKL